LVALQRLSGKSLVQHIVDVATLATSRSCPKQMLAGIHAGLHLQNRLLKALLGSQMQRKGSIAKGFCSVCFAGKKARSP